MNLKKVHFSYFPNFALQYFKNIEYKPWSMLLHSGSSKNKNNRFDIVVFDPEVILETKGNFTKIKTKKRTSFSEKDPFFLLKNEINRLNIHLDSSPDLPFQCGAIGIWSYDLGKRIEIIRSYNKKDFCAPYMAVGIYLWTLIVDHRRKTVTFLNFSEKDSKKVFFSVLKEKKTYSKGFSIIKKWKSNMSKNTFYKNFKKIYRYLTNGDCYQINFSQRFQSEYVGNEWEAFLKLNSYNQAPFSAFIRLQKNCIISLSPERFLLLNGNRNIYTSPIKGSISRSKDSEKDKEQIEKLRNSVKDRAENIMIVDLLRNDIGKVSIPGTVKVQKLCFVESFQSIHHLISTISAKLLPNYHATDLLRSCFPGGSVTGAPKIRAMEIIEELEPNRRHFYCGSIGYISFCGKMDTNINIRMLLTEKKNIYCWSGSGIVLDSIDRKEYQETFDKLSKILPIL
ncbi:aminodeoxychorismate synthase component I [Candidatus Riesia sp. GBBU]|nr:aminodeoxychorismate synthase component I [Candidatus Riesia sp. GBBU]